MRRRLIERYYWFRLLLWMVGQLVKNVVTLRWDYAEETWAFIRIHCTYPSKRVRR